MGCGLHGANVITFDHRPRDSAGMPNLVSEYFKECRRQIASRVEHAKRSAGGVESKFSVAAPIQRRAKPPIMEA